MMDPIILAKDVQLTDASTHPNDNQLILGGTGTGKSFSVILPTLLHMENSNPIATFAKRSIAEKAAIFFKDKGYRTFVWDLTNPQKGQIPDPLAYVKSDDDIQEIAHQIAYSNEQYRTSTKSDPFFRDACEALISALIYTVMMTTNGHPTTKKVIDLFYKLIITENGKGIETTLDPVIAQLEKKAPNSVAARKLRSFTQLPYVTAGCVRDDVEKALSSMFSVSIQRAMSEDDETSISFETFAEEKCALFIIVSPVRRVQYAFANLMFSIAIRRLFEFAEMQKNHRLPRHVKLIFDDFSCGVPIQQFDKSISIFREADISALILCQSLSQLSATYGDQSASTIMDNCSSITYFPGSLNKQTCSYISELMNAPLEDVLFMPIGQLIVIQSGQKPIISERYNTQGDPLFETFMQQEPRHAKQEGETCCIIQP